MTAQYEQGKGNPVDNISRHPEKSTLPSSRQEREAEEFVDYIAHTSRPNALSLEDIAEATTKGSTLQAATDAVRTNNWFEPSKRLDINQHTYRAFEKVKEALTLCSSSGVILRHRQIIVPEILHQTVIQLAHEGHQGIEKTKSLLREKVWFPGINNEGEKKVKSCLACQATTLETKREPLNLSPLPKEPWKQISAYFKELSDGGYLLVVYDYYSRCPIVEFIPSVSAPVVIPRLHKIFAEFGVPAQVRTDNGPPFNGKEFKSFAKNSGFEHRKITPKWPQANGEVERFMRTIKKTIEAAIEGNRPWKHESHDMLRNYKATPHSPTGKPPAAALFNRAMRIKVPNVPNPSGDPAAIKHRDQLAKAKMKTYANRRVYVKPSNITTGDKVIVRCNPSRSSSGSPYNPKPFFVTNRKGTMVTAESEGRRITRNLSFFKKLKPDVQVTARGPGDGILAPSLPRSHVKETAESRRYPQRNRWPPAYLKDYL